MQSECIFHNHNYKSFFYFSDYDILRSDAGTYYDKHSICCQLINHIRINFYYIYPCRIAVNLFLIYVSDVLHVKLDLSIAHGNDNNSSTCMLSRFCMHYDTNTMSLGLHLSRHSDNAGYHEKNTTHQVGNPSMEVALLNKMSLANHFDNINSGISMT